MNISKNLCFIPAKADSVRLKKKNILKISGKELVYYPIKAAFECGLFMKNNIIVSTESQEIKEIALKFGANVPYLREKKLAHDPYGIEDVTLDFFEKKPEYKSFENIFLLSPSSPMIIPEDIKNAFEIYKKEKFKYLMSVSETDCNSFRAITVNNNKMIPLFSDKILINSQYLEKTYKVNGAIIIMNINDFLKTKSYYTFPVGVYIMPKERSIHIDTEFDYKLAKLIMEKIY